MAGSNGVKMPRGDKNGQNNVKAQNEMVVPFVLDISLPYEHYVYGLLKEAYGNKIIYQFEGETGYPDFLYKSKAFQAILDTQYIPEYERGSLDTYVIRQLSGYSRNLKILRCLAMKDSQIPTIPCVIISSKKIGACGNLF